MGVVDLSNVLVWEFLFRFSFAERLNILRLATLLLFFVSSNPCFADRGLEAALKSTLFNHPSILGKEAEVSARNHEIASIHGQKLPSVSIDASAQQAVQAYANLQVKQPLFTFGKISAELQLAKAKSEVEQAELFHLKRKLLEQTSTAYLNILIAFNNKTVAEDYVFSLEKLRDKVKRREAGQLATKAEVVLIEARLVQAKAQLSRQNSELARLENELLMLTQQPIDCTIKINKNWFAYSDLNKLKTEILTQSSEVIVKSKMLELAQAERLMQAKADRPTVYLKANKSLSGAGRSKAPTVGIFLETDFNGFGKIKKGRVDAYQARVDASFQDINSTKIKIVGRVTELISSRDQSKQLSLELQKSVDAIATLLASYERQYQVGNKSWLDLVNMHREYYEQKLQLNLANKDWMNSALILSALSGDLDVAIILN